METTIVESREKYCSSAVFSSCICRVFSGELPSLWTSTVFRVEERKKGIDDAPFIVVRFFSPSLQRVFTMLATSWQIRFRNFIEVTFECRLRAQWIVWRVEKGLRKMESNSWKRYAFHSWQPAMAQKMIQWSESENQIHRWLGSGGEGRWLACN